MRILAVDDEPIFLEILEASLKEQGYDDVTPVYSAMEALRELERGDSFFDCILLDIRMPGMDGVELCRKIRAMARYRRTPIMMVTVMSDREYIDDAFGAGATDYLTKPLDSIELKARMSMMQRLVAEQARTRSLEKLVSTGEEVLELKLDFDTPVPLDGFDRVIEYLALENYMLSLSIRESYGASAFTISISNASMIYKMASPVAFVGLLTDVALTIEEALKSEPALIAYAGSGVFVVVMRDSRDPDVEHLIQEINAGLDDFSAIYVTDRIPQPKIVIGATVRSSLFSRLRVNQVLDRAIASVHDGSGPAHLPRIAMKSA